MGRRLHGVHQLAGPVPRRDGVGADLVAGQVVARPGVCGDPGVHLRAFVGQVLGGLGVRRLGRREMRHLEAHAVVVGLPRIAVHEAHVVRHVAPHLLQRVPQHLLLHLGGAVPLAVALQHPAELDLLVDALRHVEDVARHALHERHAHRVEQAHRLLRVVAHVQRAVAVAGGVLAGLLLIALLHRPRDAVEGVPRQPVLRRLLLLEQPREAVLHALPEGALAGAVHLVHEARDVLVPLVGVVGHRVEHVRGVVVRHVLGAQLGPRGLEDQQLDVPAEVDLPLVRVQRTLLLGLDRRLQRVVRVVQRLALVLSQHAEGLGDELAQVEGPLVVALAVAQLQLRAQVGHHGQVRLLLGAFLGAQGAVDRKHTLSVCDRHFGL